MKRITLLRTFIVLLFVGVAATPFSPANFMSCRLYNEFTMELDRFVISSDKPLEQVRIRTLP